MTEGKQASHHCRPRRAMNAPFALDGLDVAMDHDLSGALETV